ncbi:MAG: DUF1501 domain-containing protein [Acidobacteria bacterium]|nr:DUF1501 domain-containing protein [Acidobacteriota bacterium]
MLTRRVFLKNSALAMVGVGSAPGWLARAAASTDNRRNKVLLAIFQRGACDGLNVVVPYSDERYYQMRPTIAVPRKEVLDLNGYFGLHPALRPLKALYDEKQLALIEAVGSPDATRSHFDAQDYMESGTPGLKATRDGWLNRALTAGPKPSPVRAIGIGTNLARTLRGRNPAIAVNSLNDFQIRDAMSAPAFEGLYSSSADRFLQTTARETFEAVRIVQLVQKQPYTPAHGAQYPNGRLGQALLQIARLIKAGVGVEVAFADMGGWDTHVNEVAPLGNLLTEFGGALAAFHQDLGDRIQEIAIVTMSEFGRTARENGNQGTDHGHANVMFLLGAGVQGGKIYGDWPGLAPEQLYESRDLNLTTDFRDVLGELVSEHLGNRDLKSVFPAFAGGKPRNFMG